MHSEEVVRIRVKDRKIGEERIAIIPRTLPTRGWQCNHKGYIQFTSNATRWGIKRGHHAQRVVFERLKWETPPERRVGPLFNEPAEGDAIIWHVHHMDNDKFNNAPSNLLFVPHLFNPTPSRQCPFTGRRMNVAEWFKHYGPPQDEVPF